MRLITELANPSDMQPRHPVSHLNNFGSLDAR
jgi:hypothetical protein